MNEAALNKKVVKWLNSLENCFAYKNLGGISNPGHLDVSGCLCGFRIELEGKVGDNKPTDLQWVYIRRWQAAGAITGWYNTLEKAQSIVITGAKRRGVKCVPSVLKNIK